LRRRRPFRRRSAAEALLGLVADDDGAGQREGDRLPVKTLALKMPPPRGVMPVVVVSSLAVRIERRADMHLALLALACCLVWFRRL
jgi:hypothetical protein